MKGFERRKDVHILMSRVTTDRDRGDEEKKSLMLLSFIVILLSKVKVKIKVNNNGKLEQTLNNYQNYTKELVYNMVNAFFDTNYIAPLSQDFG